MSKSVQFIEDEDSPIAKLIRVSNNFNDTKATQYRRKLEMQLGCNAEFLKQKNISNIFIASNIVEEYEFEREIKPEEKGSLLQVILYSSSFNNGRKGKLSTFLTKFEEMGFNEQQIYGLIINLFVNGLTVGGVKHPFSDFFQNGKLWEVMKKEKELLTTSVSVLTINNAQKEAERIMKRTAKMKAKETQKQQRTRRELNELSNGRWDQIDK